jgi:hypothetical protein
MGNDPSECKGAVALDRGDAVPKAEYERDAGTFDATGDYRNLFDARPDNTFLVNVA